MALCLTPAGPTFFPALSEVFGRNGMIQRALIRPGVISLQTILISCDSAQILHDQIKATILTPLHIYIIL